MIFIRNYAPDIKGSDIAVAMTETGNDVNLYLDIKGEESVNLVKSNIDGLADNMRRSIEYIGNITGGVECTENGDERTSVINILDNKPSEIAFYVKGAKTVLKDTSTLPNVIDIYKEDESDEKHYPRDMVVLILPNTIEGEAAKFSLVVDRRNLGAPTNTITLTNYTIIIMYVKWPIWSKLKFPAYIYVQAEFESGRESIQMASFKLGTTNNKGIAKNQLIEVDAKEAYEYLQESFKILRERSKERNSTRDNRKPFNDNGGRPGFRKDRDNRKSPFGGGSGFNRNNGFNKNKNSNFSSGYANNKKTRNTRSYK